jgi:hypothetical protein
MAARYGRAHFVPGIAAAWGLPRHNGRARGGRLVARSISATFRSGEPGGETAGRGMSACAGRPVSTAAASVVRTAPTSYACRDGGEALSAQGR